MRPSPVDPNTYVGWWVYLPFFEFTPQLKDHFGIVTSFANRFLVVCCYHKDCENHVFFDETGRNVLRDYHVRSIEEVRVLPQTVYGDR